MHPTKHPAALGMRAIVLYKLVKAALQLTLAVVVIVLAMTGFATKAHEFATTLRQHASSAWSVHVAELLERGATSGKMELTGVALALDGILTAIEGWSLRTGREWGPWLVVVATGSLLPVEVYELVRRPRVGRLALLVVNALIVVYLARRIDIERRPSEGVSRPGRHRL